MDTISPLFQFSAMPEGYEAVFVDPHTYRKEVAKIFSEVFPPRDRAPDFEFSLEHKTKLQKLAEQFSSATMALRILVLEKASGRVVGWVWGEQHDWETFYLRNSGFVPDARRKGLYTAVHLDVINFLHQQG